MSEALFRREHRSSHPELGKLVEYAEPGYETHIYSHSQREALGSLAVKQAEVEKMLVSGNVTLKSLFESFRSAAQEGKRPKVKILSAYSVLIDPTVPAPDHIFPPPTT